MSKSLREPFFLRSRCGRGRKAFRTKTLSKNKVFSHSCGRPVGFTCTYGYSLPPGAKTKFGFSVKPNVTRDKIFKCILKQPEVRESNWSKIRVFIIPAVPRFGLAEKASWLTVFWLGYSRFREKSLRALPQRERRKKGSRKLFGIFSGLRL